MNEITPLTADDFKTIYQIEQQAHLVPWSEGTLLNNQGERYLNLKISDQNQIVGFAICQVVLDEATLFNLAISPSFQGRGYGKKLLSGLIKALTEKGVLTLWLEVRASNVKAQALYESLGFNLVSERKNYYPTQEGGRENALVMALYLA